MFFSIIVPVYNVEEYLIECIDSVLRQTFADFEFILVDDGSTDQSGKICDEYAQKDDRIKVIHKENGGLSDARNIGTSVSMGEYIIYIDSDDYICSNYFLQRIYDKAQGGADVICYKYKKYFENSKKFSEINSSFSGLDSLDTFYDRLKHFVSTDTFNCSAWSKAVRADVIKDNKIEFKKGLTGEDQDWYFYVLMYSKSIEGIDEDFIIYRQRIASITRSLKNKNIEDCMYIVDKWQKNILGSDMEKEYKEAFLNMVAVYYCNLLICYTLVKNKSKKTYLPKLKELSFLLNYHLSPRVRLFSMAYKWLGFRMTMLALKIICGIKG